MQRCGTLDQRIQNRFDVFGGEPVADCDHLGLQRINLPQEIGNRDSRAEKKGVIPLVGGEVQKMNPACDMDTVAHRAGNHQFVPHENTSFVI